jgi:hypothetical protein
MIEGRRKKRRTRKIYDGLEIGMGCKKKKEGGGTTI